MGVEKNVERLSFNKEIYNIAVGTASYQLTKLQVTTIVAATDNSGHITVILPPPGDCIGQIFYVGLTTRATSDVLVHDIQHQTALLCTLDATGEDVVLYCTGLEWIPIGGTYS